MLVVHLFNTAALFAMYIPTVETDIPLADFTPTFESLEDRVSAALTSLLDVEHLPTPTEQERTQGRQLFKEGRATAADLSQPGVVVHLAALLSEYDRTVVQSAAQLRTYVTNRLILETDNPDPRIRIKSLELLGKISDVGLFTDKTEITLRHRPTEELEQMLRERLTQVIDNEPILPPAPVRLDIQDITGSSE